MKRTSVQRTPREAMWVHRYIPNAIEKSACPLGKEELWR
jgi:hypothetical protein